MRADYSREMCTAQAIALPDRRGLPSATMTRAAQTLQERSCCKAARRDETGLAVNGTGRKPSNVPAKTDQCPG